MEKIIAILAVKKGIWIGFGAGVLKVAQCINNGQFKPFKAVLNIVSATIMGYMMWEVGCLLQISIPVVAAATVISSFNAFLTVEAITDKNILRLILDKYLSR